MNLTKLSGPKLEALIARLDAERSTALAATIAAGMGQCRHYEIVDIASRSELFEKTRIARAYLQTHGAWLEAVEEMDARKRYHGGTKPIKRAAY